MSRCFITMIAVLAALVGTPAVAGVPVAMVEDATGKTPVEPLDYLSEGQVVKLAPGAAITIGYFGSCQREMIAGGTVTVGVAQSAVSGGTVKREKVECDGGRMLLSADQNESGALSFRGPSNAKFASAQFVVYNRTPLLDVKGPGELVIERLDKKVADVRLRLTADKLAKGRLFDLAKAKTELEPGGIYQISADDRSVVFKVDDKSTDGKGPLISRLIRLY